MMNLKIVPVLICLGTILICELSSRYVMLLWCRKAEPVAERPLATCQRARIYVERTCLVCLTYEYMQEVNGKGRAKVVLFHGMKVRRERSSLLTSAVDGNG
jgi:hypothetical protein